MRPKRATRAGRRANGLPGLRHGRGTLGIPAGLLVVALLQAGLPAVPGVSSAPQAQSAAQQIRFHSETIRLVVEPGRLAVNGHYRFVAPESAREDPLLLFFPYPQDSLLGAAEMALLQVAGPDGEWRSAAFTEDPDGRGARWRLPLVADTTLIRAIYHQALRGPYARYIATTTTVWRHPLEHVRFEVFLPESARAPEFSYPFEDPEKPGAPYVYEAEDFLPERDISVRWSW